MSVRSKLALTVFATGVLTALLVVATVVWSFRRFENETAYRRGIAFLDRVAAQYEGLSDIRERSPIEFERWLRGLVLYAPDVELYLLDRDGTVLAKTGAVRLPAGFRVRLAPVLESIDNREMPYVMGDDPERMDAGAVVAARPVRRDAAGAPVAGYFYLVLHTQQLPEGRWDALRSSVARPALVLVVAVVALTTLLAALVIASVTEPLRRLTGAVSTLSKGGLSEGLEIAPGSPLPPRTGDEFGRLTAAFEMLLEVCRRQWNALRRADQYRREGVSNLSHDLRSPLTATVACLETLEQRWTDDERAADRRLVEIALRNTRNAARMVQSLGDLAKLDEPEFRLQRTEVDAGELLDDIAHRFAERAARLGVALRVEGGGARAAIDVELFERAVANLIDNALKFCRAGDAVTLTAAERGELVEVVVADDGPGIAAADLPFLFDRFYRSRGDVAPASADEGRGLGLAIVKRIAELHGGDVGVDSAPGRGTRVALTLPRVAEAGASRTGESPRARIRGAA